MKKEYRVVWKREGLKKKIKRYSNYKSAFKWTLLLGPTPWLYFGKEELKKWCCSGNECACGGFTCKEYAESVANGMPKIEYIRIEEREVGEWKR